MRVLNDFRCPECGTVSEEYLEASVTTVPCRECSATATRLRTPIRVRLPRNDPGFPGAYDKWGRDYLKRQVKANSEESGS